MSKNFKISTQTKDDFFSAAPDEQNRKNILSELKNIVTTEFDLTNLIDEVEIKNHDDGLIHHFELQTFSIDMIKEDGSKKWSYNFVFNYVGFTVL